MNKSRATWQQLLHERWCASVGWMRALAVTLVVALCLGACAHPLSGQTNPGNRESDGGLSLSSSDAAEAEAAEPYVGLLYDDYPVPPFVGNTEEYAHVDERGFSLVSTRPLSTVSADVDTASFANLRRLLRQGTTLDEIPAGAVRLEELLNYLDYDYMRPTSEDFAITAQVAPCPWNPDTRLLVMGFSTASEPRTQIRGRNLVFLIDVSGSMEAPDKLSLLKSSFAALIEGLDEHDCVSIVTYASGERLMLDGVSGADKARILTAVESLYANGSTNGERGLELAYEQAQKHFIEGGVNRIILASDGDLNVGMTSESELYDYVNKKRETGIYLSVLGFGSGNYKDNKMEVLADNGNGSYHYIDCIEEAERVFSERLCANLVPFADDAKVQIEFNPAVVKAWRLLGYENRAMADEDFINDDADAGEVGPNSCFTVAYELVCSDSNMELPALDLKYQEREIKAQNPRTSNDWASVALRYRSYDTGRVEELGMSVGAQQFTDTPTQDFHRAAAVLELGLLTRDSAWKGDASLEGAWAELEAAGGLHDEKNQSLIELFALAHEGQLLP